MKGKFEQILQIACMSMCARMCEREDELFKSKKNNPEIPKSIQQEIHRNKKKKNQ